MTFMGILHQCEFQCIFYTFWLTFIGKLNVLNLEFSLLLDFLKLIQEVMLMFALFKISATMSFCGFPCSFSSLNFISYQLIATDFSGFCNNVFCDQPGSFSVNSCAQRYDLSDRWYLVIYIWMMLRIMNSTQLKFYK